MKDEKPPQMTAYYESIAANNTSDGIMVQTLDGRILWCNPAYCALHGRSLDEIVGRNPLSFALPEDARMTEAEVAAFRFDTADPRYGVLHQRRNRRADGTEFWNQMSVQFQTAPDGVVHAITVCRDATAQTLREQELNDIRERLEHAVSHDSLTGIANHHAFLRFLKAALAQAAALGGSVGILRIDLDRFKDINDTHGHAAGDAVLVRVGQILKARVRKDDLVARVGGDEFAVICPRLDRLPELQAMAADLRYELARPFAWGSRSLACTASIGAALSQPGAADYEQLLQQSDFALYEVKRNGRDNIAAFDEDLHRRHGRHHRQLEEFAAALREGRIDFVFQPVLSTLSGKVAGVETLARWTHPAEGPVDPARFLALAAELGRMADVDRAAVRAAIDMKARLTRAGHPEVRVGFNASMAALTDDDYIAALIDGITRSGMPPDHFVLEILETVILGNRGANPLDNIERLAGFGLEVLLDDFGNGYAGLAQLARLPLTGVKIDQTLIRDVISDPKIGLVVSTLISLCQKLGLSVIVEGVEDLTLARRLTAYGSRFIQGYWLARPLSAEAVVGFFDAHDPVAALARIHHDAPHGQPTTGTLPLY